jgi:hypothetical protein
MNINIKRIFVLVTITFLIMIAFVGLNASAIDTDGDGLDDDWEAANDYDNTTKDKVVICDEDDKVAIYDDDEWDREEKEDDLINIFLFVLIMSFGIFSLLAGIFTSYFGAGKSRAIGGFLLVIGIVIILIWVYFGVMQDYPDDTILGIVHWEAAKTLEAFLTVLGAIIGALIAIGVFLLAIMKS